MSCIIAMSHPTADSVVLEGLFYFLYSTLHCCDAF